MTNIFLINNDIGNCIPRGIWISNAKNVVVEETIDVTINGEAHEHNKFGVQYYPNNLLSN